MAKNLKTIPRFKITVKLSFSYSHALAKFKCREIIPSVKFESVFFLTGFSIIKNQIGFYVFKTLSCRCWWWTKEWTPSPGPSYEVLCPTMPSNRNTYETWNCSLCLSVRQTKLSWSVNQIKRDGLNFFPDTLRLDIVSIFDQELADTLSGWFEKISQLEGDTQTR